MPLRTLRRTAAAAVLSLLVLVPAARAAGSIPQTDCFWQTRTTSMFDSSGDSNYAFPDSGAVYWAAKVTMPAGSRIVLKGRFAHARYQSINSYNKANNAPIDALNDVSTAPDPGSTNPFLPGAKRNSKRRGYTITVLNEPVPAADRAANTVYAGVAGQPDQLLVLRVYIPDSFKRAELTGGVGLPQLELHLADGSVQTGAQACTTLSAQGGPLSVTTLPKPLYESLRNKRYATPGFPAAASPAWYAFYNSGFLIACGYQGACTGQPARTGGQYSNIDNQYVSTFVNRSAFGGPVLVLKGKLPTTVRSGPKVKRMGRGQLRYWSICQNESLYTTKGAGCLFDRQIPVDRKGRYTIVSSLAADRPANAKTKCGVGFLPWAPNGDGDGNLSDGFLIVRNMLPAKTFTHAVQNTKTPGDEAAVMGPYLPKGSYTTKATFAKRGC